MKNVIVGQSGGPTSVINASLLGVYKTAKDRGADKIYGMVHGIEGFLEDKLIELEEYLEEPTGIELLKRTPSAFLGSCRFKMPKIEGHEDVYEKVFEIMEKHDIECLFYAGGNDSMDTVKMLSDYAAAHNKPQRFMSSPLRSAMRLTLLSPARLNPLLRDALWATPLPALSLAPTTL